MQQGRIQPQGRALGCHSRCPFASTASIPCPAFRAGLAAQGWCGCLRHPFLDPCWPGLLAEIIPISTLLDMVLMLSLVSV